MKIRTQRAKALKALYSTTGTSRLNSTDWHNMRRGKQAASPGKGVYRPPSRRRLARLPTRRPVYKMFRSLTLHSLLRYGWWCCCCCRCWCCLSMNGMTEQVFSLSPARLHCTRVHSWGFSPARRCGGSDSEDQHGNYDSRDRYAEKRARRNWLGWIWWWPVEQRCAQVHTDKSN